MLVLRLLRESCQMANEMAHNGNFQRALANTRPPLLARIAVEAGHAVVPEVSANKYTVNVRFLDQSPQFQGVGRAGLTTRNIPFKLALCAL